MGEEREQSEFNMAFSYLNRLNFLFYDCAAASMSLDVFKWYHSLLAIYREISTEMKPDELTKSRDYKDKISPLINAALEKQGVTGKLVVSSKLYNELHEFELFLRGIMKKSGLQLKMADDASRALR